MSYYKTIKRFFFFWEGGGKGGWGHEERERD